MTGGATIDTWPPAVKGTAGSVADAALQLIARAVRRIQETRLFLVHLQAAILTFAAGFWGGLVYVEFAVIPLVRRRRGQPQRNSGELVLALMTGAGMRDAELELRRLASSGDTEALRALRVLRVLVALVLAGIVLLATVFLWFI